MVSMPVALTPVSPGELKLPGDVRLGSLTLNYLDPTTGVLWLMTDMDGWWTLADVAMPDDPLPMPSDGSWDEDGQFKARLVTLKGAFAAPDILSFQAARTQLIEACNLVHTAGVLQADETVTKQAVVRLTSTPVVDTNRLSRLCFFSVPLRASDPLKYSSATLSGSTQLGQPSSGRTYPKIYNRVYVAASNPGQVIVINTGDASSPGVVTFYGPVQSPSVESVEAGAHLTINATLDIGDVLTLDLSDYTVTLNGTADYRSFMSADSDWFLIIPGTNTLRFTGVQQIPANPPTVPNALMSVLARSAWYV